MRFSKSESGAVTATCQDCGRIFEMSSEWDVANLDWHQCAKVGA